MEFPHEQREETPLLHYEVGTVHHDEQGLQVVEIMTEDFDKQEPRNVRITYGDLDGDWDCLSANDSWAVLVVDSELSDDTVLDIATQLVLGATNYPD